LRKKKIAPMNAPKTMIPMTIPAIAPVGRLEFCVVTFAGVEELLVFASDAKVDEGTAPIVEAVNTAFGTLLDVAVAIAVEVANAVSVVRAFDVELAFEVVVLAAAIVSVSKINPHPKQRHTNSKENSSKSTTRFWRIHSCTSRSHKPSIWV
jgi:hypothetical protein